MIAVPVRRNFVQIGAGAGDRDARADNRDGFSEIIKRLHRSVIGKIILVEPNPLNLEALRECWSGYPEAAIHQLAIVPRQLAGMPINLYFADADAPHYQVASVDPAHVLKHYPALSGADLKMQVVPTRDLAGFLADQLQGEPIELLGLDIEGIDAEVLLDTDFGALEVSYLSFEFVHLGGRRDAVVSHLERCGFAREGSGLDHNGNDWLFHRVRA